MIAWDSNYIYICTADYDGSTAIWKRTKTKQFLGTEEFERCKPYIEAALEYTGGTHDIIDIYEGLYKGTMQLYLY